MLRWFTFEVFVPGDTPEDGYTFEDSAMGLDLEDAKSRYREENDNAIVLAGGHEDGVQ